MGAEKMSKSLGNVLSISNIEKMGYSPLDLRYYFLSVHYRTQLKFAEKGMEDAKKARRKIVEWMEEVETWATDAEMGGEDAGMVRDPWERKFKDAMDSDLNTPEALAVVFDLMAWSRTNREKFSKSGFEELQKQIQIIQDTFGCFEAAEVVEIPSEVQELLNMREKARGEKNFEESDRLRKEIEGLGFDVRDTDNGQKISRM